MNLLPYFKCFDSGCWHLHYAFFSAVISCAHIRCTCIKLCIDLFLNVGLARFCENMALPRSSAQSHSCSTCTEIPRSYMGCRPVLQQSDRVKLLSIVLLSSLIANSSSQSTLFSTGWIALPLHSTDLAHRARPNPKNLTISCPKYKIRSFRTFPPEPEDRPTHAT